MKASDFDRAYQLTQARTHLLRHRDVLAASHVLSASVTLKDQRGQYSMGLTPEQGLANHVYVPMREDEQGALHELLVEIVRIELENVENELAALGVEVD